MVEITLEIDETEVNHLSHTSCSGDILQNQPDRFETDTTNVSRGHFGPEDPTIQDILSRDDLGTMFWCNNWVEAKLLKTYLNAQGHYAHIMWDSARDYDYFVWSSENYDGRLNSIRRNNRAPVDYMMPNEE